MNPQRIMDALRRHRGIARTSGLTQQKAWLCKQDIEALVAFIFGHPINDIKDLTFMGWTIEAMPLMEPGEIHFVSLPRQSEWARINQQYYQQAMGRGIV